MTPVRDLLPRTAAAFDEGLVAGLHRGAQLYVSRRGRPLADAAFGHSRLGMPMTPDTLTLWLSAGKPLTAAAIARLEEQRRLAFDDPVCYHLPEFAAGGKETITLRHVLTHTGGFRDADRIPETVSWDEAVRRVCESPLEPGWIPGWQAGYHRSGSWYVLGEIVRRLTGMPLSRYVREQILLPWGLSNTWLGMPAAEYRRYAERIGFTYLTQHHQTRPHPHWNTEAGCGLERPGSNVRGPIRELGRFYEALLALRTARPMPGGAVLSSATAVAMTTRQTTGLYDQTMRHPVDWGLGFYLRALHADPGPAPYSYGPHASGDTFGHSGAQSSCAFADPPRELVVAWLCNGLPGEPRHQERAWRINTCLYEDLGLTG
ncbi:MAG: beta-lactamase family protein [Verrucomicrobia bacterium]|nr:beta-lactamase family protein [Verrucomicrobiota bacterium]